jgi:hypothetical protein
MTKISLFYVQLGKKLFVVYPTNHDVVLDLKLIHFQQQFNAWGSEVQISIYQTIF